MNDGTSRRRLLQAGALGAGAVIAPGTHSAGAATATATASPVRSDTEGKPWLVGAKDYDNVIEQAFAATSAHCASSPVR